MLLGSAVISTLQSTFCVTGSAFSEVRSRFKKTASRYVVYGDHYTADHITIDLKHPAGVAIIKRFAARGDVLVENDRAGIMERLGLCSESCGRSTVYATA